MTSEELEKLSRELRLKISLWNETAWESFGSDQIDNAETGEAALSQGRDLRLLVTNAMLDAAESLRERLREIINSDLADAEALKESFRLINTLLSLNNGRGLIARNEGMIYGMSFHSEERRGLAPYQAAEKQLGLFDSAAAPGWVG